jgi:predicted DNA-binding transcriptional regulator AlpA
MTDEEFISLPDAAQLLFVSRSHVAKLVSRGMFTWSAGPHAPGGG